MDIMCTGHREVSFPQEVYQTVRSFFWWNDYQFGVAGGAEGADTIFAEATRDAGHGLNLIYPNQYYTQIYPKSYKTYFLKYRYAVERPTCDDWRERWHKERWWTDNFVRNRQMIDESDATMVISPRNPLDLVLESKGGTASCLKDVRKKDPSRKIFWVTDEYESKVIEMKLSDTPQLELFE